jgi:hypothetical protein
MAEASIIWILVVVSFIAAGVIVFLLHSDYVKRRTAVEEKNEEIREKVEQLDQQISSSTKELKNLERKVKLKEKKDKEQQEELERKLASLEKTIIHLPPYEYWPDLISLVEKLAEQKQVYISNFTMVDRQDLESKNTKDTFTENIFVLDMEGDYSRLMEYIWYLENAIYLSGRGNTQRWRAIIKVVHGGFSIQQLNTEDETVKLRLQLMTFFRKGVGSNVDVSTKSK